LMLFTATTFSPYFPEYSPGRQAVNRGGVTFVGCAGGREATLLPLTAA